MLVGGCSAGGPGTGALGFGLMLGLAGLAATRRRR
jgi:MYXO-CTERM domain-containing protein